MAHKLIIKENTAPAKGWTGGIQEILNQVDLAISPDMEYGTTICIHTEEQVLSIIFSPDCLKEPTIKITLATKEDSNDALDSDPDDMD